MALTSIQRDVCQLLAAARRQSGESYVAGGAALGEALRASRVSRDIDIFHDTEEAVSRSWERDRVLLESAGYTVSTTRDRPGFVEAAVARGDESLSVEWTRDSAFRFFPLVEDETFGLALHPFDLATNKVLALVGRLEPRDWVDVILCHEGLQPLGYLAWAAAGKDPGFTPLGILEQAGRSARYSVDELAVLRFDGPAPTAQDLSTRWHGAMAGAPPIIRLLPRDTLGTAVISASGELFRGDADQLAPALADQRLLFHAGHIGGAWPRLKI